MNSDGSKQRYVSTFKMRIKAPGPSPAPENGPGIVGTRTSVKCTDAGKSCFQEENTQLVTFMDVSIWTGKSEHGSASW